LEPPAHNAELRDLRNALEHLDDAVLNKGYLAEAGDDPKSNRSLRRVAGGKITIATGGKLFGRLDLGHLETIGREHSERMEDEAYEREEALIEAAVESYLDEVLAERRELR
jgi:hypothetical protein